MELFEALAFRRKELGMKYELLSERSHIPVNTLKKIFTGNIAAPSFESIKAIVYAMDWTLEELDGKIEEKSGYAAEDIALLNAFHALDAPGKAAVTAALESQQQRIKEYGRLEKKPGVNIRMPLIQGTHEAEAQICYQSKREQQELHQSETLQSDPT